MASSPLTTFTAALGTALAAAAGEQQPPATPPRSTSLHAVFAIDTETTGLRSLKQACGIVEFGAVHCGTGATFLRRVKPRVRVSSSALGIHGLSDSLLAGEPTLDAVWRDFASWARSLAGARTIVLLAYNGATFDFPVIRDDLARYNMAIPTDWLFADLLLHVRGSRGCAHIWPTAKAAKQMKLTLLHAHVLGVGFDGAHSALADALALHRLAVHAVTTVVVDAVAFSLKTFTSAEMLAPPRRAAGAVPSAATRSHGGVAPPASSAGVTTASAAAAAAGVVLVRAGSLGGAPAAVPAPAPALSAPRPAPLIQSGGKGASQPLLPDASPLTDVFGVGPLYLTRITAALKLGDFAVAVVSSSTDSTAAAVAASAASTPAPRAPASSGGAVPAPTQQEAGSGGGVGGGVGGGPARISVGSLRAAFMGGALAGDEAALRLLLTGPSVSMFRPLYVDSVVRQARNID